MIDLGSQLRLILLDTAWWLLGSDPEEKDEVMEGVAEALDAAGSRRVVMAAHHPLESGGPHGSVVDFGRSLGLRYVLQKAGLLLQDLDSRPYDDLRSRLREIFAQVDSPAFFVGGHEHSLQVFASGETESERSAVIGSASKLTSVRYVPGMLFGRSEPGYGKIFVLRDGTLHFRIEAAPASYLECEDEQAREDDSPTMVDESCLNEGEESFRTVWAEELNPRR